MKKLLFTISQLYKGGAETSLVNLLNHLDYSKYEVDLLILNQEPVKNAVSLIDRVNSNVAICDAYKEYQKITVLDRIRVKYIYTAEQKGAYYVTALDFVRNKIYDWAFFVGEWYTPSFVAYEVQARIKAAWIHNDLSSAEYFDADHYFYFADMYDYYIFVSKNSLEASIKKYPFLKDKSITIYNISDVEYIKNRSIEGENELAKYKKPIVLTCANFRQQKNHLRQVKVMAELKKRGIDFTWVNIGATTDMELVNRVKTLCEKEDISDRFIIVGPQENPYSYMKDADIVSVLSDYESWSMVITEAKVLGKPIIATKTSGALEQIEDRVTGILTDFNKNDIADKLEELLTNTDLRQKIEYNVKKFDNTDEILHSFNVLIESGVSYKKRKMKSVDEKRILYVIDDINYMGGAHIATKLQIKKFVNEGRNVSIFAGNVPNLKVRTELPGVRFLSWKDFREDVIYNKPLLNCLTDSTLMKEEKKNRVWQIKEMRFKKDPEFYRNNILPELKKLFSQYDIICVMSEGSNFREVVAASSCRRKIQWIHIDYNDWKDKSEWNRKISKNDGELYKNFDAIVLLSDGIRDSFAKLYPHLREKLYVNKNLIPVEEIRRKAHKKEYINKVPVKFITVGRLDYQKAYPRLIKILSKLRKEGYNFRWSIVGGGDEFWNVKGLIDNAGLSDWVKMKGELDNPFIEMIKADVFALLSDFEGIPNTIYEALILGIPVLATDVGGVASQIDNGVTGWLVDNDEEEIYEKIKSIIGDTKQIGEIKKNISHYRYDNDFVNKNNHIIFFE